MKKPIIHEFDPVIYPVKLWIVEKPTQDFIDENFEETNGSKLNLGVHNAAVMCCYNQIVVNKTSRLYGVVISVWNKPRVGDIAHESTHAARFIWDWLEEGNTGVEADAYLVGWIAKCIGSVREHKASTP